MQNFWVGVALLLVALLFGASLWGGVHAIWLLDIPHHKFVKYGALLTALVLIVWWARNRVNRSQMGLGAPLGALFLHVLIGFSVTVTVLMPLWIFLLMSGTREADLWVWSERFAYHAATYLGVGLLVAIIEELYFRGVLLSQVTARAFVPAIASSLLYAVLHFLSPENRPELVGQLQGGWILLLEAARDLPSEALADAPRLVLLILIGYSLALVRLRTGQLALCIGIHAAMVFSIKLFQKYTDAGDATLPGLATDPLGGWAAALWVGLVLLALQFTAFNSSFLPKSPPRF